MIFAHGEAPHEETNQMQEMMRNMMGEGPMQFMGPAMVVFGLLLFALVALGIVALLRYLSRGTKEGIKGGKEREDTK